MVLKVLHITNAYPCAEIPEYGVFVKEQIESLPPDHIDSRVVFVNGRSQGKLAYLRAVSDVKRKIPESDVIHCHHAYSFLVAALAGVVGRKPVVLSFLNDWTHEVKDLPSQWLREMVCRACVRMASKVIFKSPVPYSLRGSQKAINLPNGVDANFFQISDRDDARRELGLEPEARYLLFVSSKNKYREQKRYDIFAEVVRLVGEARPGERILEYVMVGQPRSLVPSVFSACDVHVLTSDYEGSPNSVKEALCCGTRVVARDVGNVSDMLRDVAGTAVVKSDDPGLIASAVLKTLDLDLTSQEIRDSFLAKGITKQLIAERLVELYTSLAVGKHA